ncbi:MAG: hypothetical protein IJ998_06350 [Alistipes sp.]|nr:hypothetical protein [Alistipes sp.]
MTQKIETLSYISKLSREAIQDEIQRHNDKLEKIRITLAERGETLADAQAYQIKGVAWKRKQVIAECEAWMDATNCPDYLREDNRKKAYDSCDNEYIKSVSSAFFGLKLDLTNDVDVTPEGKWVVKQSVVDAKLEELRYTLTPEEVEAYRIYEQIIDLAEELHKRRYYISDTFGSTNDNLERIEDEEARLEYFTMLYVMTPEEVAERKRQLGFD